MKFPRNRSHRVYNIVMYYCRIQYYIAVRYCCCRVTRRTCNIVIRSTFNARHTYTHTHNEEIKHAAMNRRLPKTIGPLLARYLYLETTRRRRHRFRAYIYNIVQQLYVIIITIIRCTYGCATYSKLCTGRTAGEMRKLLRLKRHRRVVV